MDSKGPQITWVEQSKTAEDELEEELVFIEMNMSLLNKAELDKPFYQEMELRKKEIEMKLKLIKMEKDF
jgi:hypothetical protein